MIGLVLKDIYNINNNIKSLLLMLLVMGMAIMPSGGIGAYIIASTLICSMIVLTTITYDHNSKWDKFSLTMAVSRKDIVLSKYIILGIFILYGLSISCIISCISSLFVTSLTLDNILVYIISALVVSLFSGSIMMPLLFKYGAEKARILMYVGLLIPIIIGSVLMWSIEKFNIQFTNENIANLILYLIPLVLLVIILFSFYISLKIYKNKEF